MRLAAYKKAIDEAKELPKSIPELSCYFKVFYSPSYEAMRYILEMARKDGYLDISELCELRKYI